MNNQLLASDTFVSGSLAAGWSAAFGSSLSQVTGTPFVAEPTSTGSSTNQQWTGLTWPADQTSEVTLGAALSNANNGSNAAVWVRLQSGVLSGYIASWNGKASGGTISLYRCDAGSFTLLASATSIGVGAAGDVLSMQVAGNLITVYKNGAFVCGFGDVTYTSGAPGFRQDSGGNAVTTAKVASWRGYSGVQQDGIWAKQGIVIPGIAGDLQVGIQNAAMLREGNAQILSGTVFKMWFMGGADNAGKIYYAESTDGIAWTRRVGTLITGFGFPFIFKVGSTYYLYVQNSGVTAGTGNFARYSSSDGITWAQDSSNVFGLGAGGQWDSALVWYFQPVAIIGGTWYALYSGGNNTSTYQLKLGLATSTDGLTWVRSSSNPVLVGPNNGSVVNSQAFVQVGSTYYMWLFGSQPGQAVTNSNLDPGEGVRYQTTDFITWTNPVHSIHQSQMFEGVNTKTGQSYPNNIFTVGSSAYMYVQTALNDPSNIMFQMGLAIAAATVAEIVTANEDAAPQVATDAFTSGTGNLSANWATPTGFTKLQIVAGNLVEANATSTVCGMRYTGASFNDQQWSEITIQTLAASQFAEPMVRCQANSNNYNVTITGPTGTLASSVKVNKFISSASTQIGPTVAFTPQVGDVIRLTVTTGSDGNPVLSVYQNGFLLMQVEDYSNVIPSGGAPGMLISTTTLVQAQISKWSGGNANVLPTYVFSITGNAGVASAVVAYSGTASGNVTADGSGNYTIPNLVPGPYTITPSLAGYIFTPTSSNQTVVASNISGVNFTAGPATGINIVLKDGTSVNVTVSASLTKTQLIQAIRIAGGFWDKPPDLVPGATWYPWKVVKDILAGM